jgi:hypothetical protein
MHSISWIPHRSRSISDPPQAGDPPPNASGLTLWLDPTESGSLYQDQPGTTPATNDTDPVGRWNDLSGAVPSMFLGNSSAPSTPTLQIAELNGLDAIQFTSAGNSALSGANVVTGRDDWEMVLAVRPDAITATVSTDYAADAERVLVASGGNTAYGCGLIDDGGDKLAVWMASGANYAETAIAVSTGTIYVVHLRFQLSDSTLYASLDGGSEASDTIAGLEAPSDVIVPRIGTGSPGDYTLGAIWVFDGLLSSGDRAANIAALQARWQP